MPVWFSRNWRSPPERQAKAKSCHGRKVLGTSRVIEVATRGELAIGLKSYPRTLFLRPKEVILTFDDGPLPATTGKVIEALKAQCVKATFFLIGRNAAANPAIARRIAREGHTIGYHSMTHPPATLRGLSRQAAIRDIERGIVAVDRAAFPGGAAALARRTRFFRFPGFADSKALNAWLGKRNVAVFGG